MRRLIILISVLFPSFLGVSSQNLWQRAVVNYSRHEYHGANQNWMACQSRSGWMYFANNGGLLEYDGAHWATYRLPGEAKLRAVCAVGDSIFVGALGQFGVFVRDAKGRLAYRRLSSAAGEKTNVWAIHHMGGDTYFRADDTIYVNSSATAIAAGVGYTCTIGGRLYAATREGLKVLSSGRMLLLKGAAGARSDRVVGIVAQGGRLLVVTHSDGLYAYDGLRMTPLSTAADELLRGRRLSCAAVSGDMLALGTMKDGVILVDLRRRQAEHLSLGEGLQNKTVLSAAFDRDGNLWLTLDNGIDCIPMRSPLTFLSSSHSPVGSGTCSMSFGGRLYLGTNQGLYVAEGATVRPVEGTDDQVLALDTVGGWLFCGGRKFFVGFDGRRMLRFAGARGVWGVRALAGRDDALVVGDYWGLKILRREGDGWRLEGPVAGFDVSAKTIFTERGSGAVWVANKEKGLFRLTLSDDLRRVATVSCRNDAALPRGQNVAIASVDGQTVVASRQGLMRYDTTHDRLEPYGELERRLAGHTAYTYIMQDGDGRIWYATDGALHVYDGSGSSAFLQDELLEDFESVSLLPDGQHAVVGTQEGFARLAILPADSIRDRRHVEPIVSRLIIGGGTDTVSYGNTQPIRIAYGHNSVRMELSAAGSDPTQSVLYSCRLDGADRQWSPYSTRRTKEYALLPPGRYTFRLRAMTPGSHEVGQTSLTFTILPPWYRTWWAYAGYVVLMALIVGWGVRRAQESRRRLIARTNARMERQQEAFLKESEQKDQTIEELREEKLEIELRSRQEELVRSRMNVVRKNEMLQEIRKTAISLSASISEDNLPAIKRKVVRLIGQIDTNIEHDDDLEAFRGSFDAVHHDFLRKLGERYPSLSYRERMLCAYLRMNLMSKEIAPLLNISTRGVEIGRYRLRRKLGLDEGESLADFLQRI